MKTLVYKDSLEKLKGKKKALFESQRIPFNYMSSSQKCDDVFCNLCYKGKDEKNPSNPSF